MYKEQYPNTEADQCNVQHPQQEQRLNTESLLNLKNKNKTKGKMQQDVGPRLQHFLQAERNERESMFGKFPPQVDL